MVPKTIEELLKQSEKCRNYSRYDSSDWEFIAIWLIADYDVPTAYIVLNSKHMHWNPDKTLKGFMDYAAEHLTPAEITFLIESFKVQEEST